MNIYKYASPAMFYPVAGKLIPWFAIPAAILFATGLFVGFFVAPTDFQQGDAYRIIFIHVPAAWMSISACSEEPSAPAARFSSMAFVTSARRLRSRVHFSIKPSAAGMSGSR
jgi:ABC-type transport system involved in cytochrome c biogenesis permease subunit